MKKIVVRVLAIAIGLPVAAIAIVVAGSAIEDTTNGTLVSSGLTRRYLLYVPKTYNRATATPLVISFHPAAAWPALQMAISRWNDVADRHGVIVV